MKSLQFKFQTGCSSYGSNTWKVGFPLLRTWGKNFHSFHSFTWLWLMPMSNLQQIICSMQAFFLINDPWLLPYKSFLWHIHYKSITNTLTLTQDQRVRVARSAHEVDPLQPELRPACANTTRVETPRIAVWDILTTWKWKWKMKVLSYLTDYFQMHWHADKNLFSNALACTHKSFFQRLLWSSADDNQWRPLLAESWGFFTQKHFLTDHQWWPLLEESWGFSPPKNIFQL